jgi:Holliday junction resolvasome RuvABC ATP-dependent DNA helicase subunit
MLSNITVDGRTSLQTILLGQPQFRRMLTSPNLDQLRQRVLTSYHLGPLSLEETRAYIEHRLNAVGWNDDPHWDDDAFTAVFSHTNGIPRRINRLCSRVLLYGVLEETHHITAQIVDTTAIELAQDLEGVRQDFAEHAGLNGEEPRLPSGPASVDDLLLRVESLEQQMAMRERVFRRLTQMLGVQG